MDAEHTSLQGNLHSTVHFSVIRVRFDWVFFVVNDVPLKDCCRNERMRTQFLLFSFND